MRPALLDTSTLRHPLPDSLDALYLSSICVSLALSVQIVASPVPSQTVTCITVLQLLMHTCSHTECVPCNPTASTTRLARICNHFGNWSPSCWNQRGRTDHLRVQRVDHLRISTCQLQALRMIYIAQRYGCYKLHTCAAVQNGSLLFVSAVLCRLS